MLSNVTYNGPMLEFISRTAQDISILSSWAFIDFRTETAKFFGPDATAVAIKRQMGQSIRPISQLQQAAVAAGKSPEDVDLKVRDTTLKNGPEFTFFYSAAPQILMLSL